MISITNLNLQRPRRNQWQSASTLDADWTPCNHLILFIFSFGGMTPKASSPGALVLQFDNAPFFFVILYVSTLMMDKYLGRSTQKLFNIHDLLYVWFGMYVQSPSFSEFHVWWYFGKLATIWFCCDTQIPVKLVSWLVNYYLQF